MSIVLRSITVNDEPALIALFADPQVRQWNPVKAGTLVGEWWTEGVSDTHHTWAIADPADGRLLGTVAVFEMFDGAAKIGYRVLGTEAGRGAATAAVRAAVEEAHTRYGVARLQLEHAQPNVGSCRVAEKAGFVLERTVPGTEAYGDGATYDEHIHLYRRANSVTTS